MRDEKQAADQAQYVDAVGEIEILQISGHIPPGPPRIFLLISLGAAQLPSPPRLATSLPRRLKHRVL
jgi:hypothetical protein